MQMNNKKIYIEADDGIFQSRSLHLQKNITEETEQANIVNLLQKYDYTLIDKNRQEGNIKLVFHHD